MLAGCQTSAGPPVSAKFGAAQEPRAARAGRIALETGGNAVDAAVTMALTLVATLPSRVGPAGGGVCMVHDPAHKDVRSLYFLAESPQAGAGLLRGLYTLHAAYGRLAWERALGEAESLAALGTPVSQALAEDLKAGASRLAGDANARRVFFGANGQVLAEDDTITQPALAATLRTVRSRGVGAFYTSAGSGSVASAVAGELGLDAGSLAATRAEWRPTIAVEQDSNMVHFPGGAGGTDLARAWQVAVESGKTGGAAALIGALGAGGSEAPTASVVAVDANEQAAACVLTMGGLFGNGRVGPETGLLGAGRDGASGIGGPVLMVNSHQSTTLFAGTGTTARDGGTGRSAETAVLSALYASVIGEVAGPAITASAPASGRVQAVACQYSRYLGTKNCEAVSDMRGTGQHFMVIH